MCHFQSLGWCENHESMAALGLDDKNAPIRCEIVTADGCGRVLVPIRLLAGFALDAGAKGLIIAHNHPSSDPSPSVDDIIVTRQIALWLRPLGVHLVDHLILGGVSYVSLRDSGVM